MRFTNFGSFGNMHIRNGLFGYPRRNAAKRGFPWFCLVIVMSMLSSWVNKPKTDAERETQYQRELEIWRAHPEWVAHPTRSK